MAALPDPAQLAPRRLPNLWDAVAVACVFAALAALGHVARGTLVPLDAAEALAVSLDPLHLPLYAARTTLRMVAALAASLIFTFTYATWAAKSPRAARLLIPLLDILQSVPILGFLSFTVVFFMSLFPGKVLGAELAAIFAVFTSQAWNMAFSLYQSLTTIPSELEEAASSFRLTAWQRFWRLEVPFAVPGLVWNTMLSMSGGWFFVVASEAVSVGDTTWKLPGIGSYVALALEKRDTAAVLWAILAMGLVILAYDQLLFRPLVAWSGKFRYETAVASAEAEDPWLLVLLRQTRVLRVASEALGAAFARLGGLRLLPVRARRRGGAAKDTLWLVASLLAVIIGLGWTGRFLRPILSPAEIATCVELGLLTLARVLVVVAVSCLLWVPIGVRIGLHPRWARRVQPAAQFMAAFPANLLFPLVVMLIVRFDLLADVWLTPLMLLGTQWYILFNVIAGAAALPAELKEVAANFGLRGLLWWRRLILPGILPYLITGTITASGAAWNASIVTEVASWGTTKLVAHGLGAYIAAASDAGDMRKLVLGIAVMSAFVVLFNRALWRPLYDYTSRRATF